jgi:ribonuclease HII
MITNKDIKSLSFAEIKEEIYKLSIVNLYKNGESTKIIDWLKDDKRKNVLSLKNKIQRESDLYLNEIKRVKEMYDFDKSFGNYSYVAGVDEV